MTDSNGLGSMTLAAVEHHFPVKLTEMDRSDLATLDGTLLKAGVTRLDLPTIEGVQRKHMSEAMWSLKSDVYVYAAQLPDKDLAGIHCYVAPSLQRLIQLVGNLTVTTMGVLPSEETRNAFADFAARKEIHLEEVSLKMGEATGFDSFAELIAFLSRGRIEFTSGDLNELDKKIQQCGAIPLGADLLGCITVDGPDFLSESTWKTRDGFLWVAYYSRLDNPEIAVLETDFCTFLLTLQSMKNTTSGNAPSDGILASLRKLKG